MKKFSSIKDTLFMNISAFSMKANLISLEPKIRSFWKTNDIYNKRLTINKNNEIKIIFDGPPYANGNIHVGHALNKILKDILVRFYLMKGFYCEHIMGWDMHGLPIENAILKKNSDAKDWDYYKIRQKCGDFAKKNAENQLMQFEKLGLISINYKKYFTNDKLYIKQELEKIYYLFKNDLIYQDIKPVCWSWSSQSVLAEAEIQYKQVNSTSVFVEYLLNNSKLFGNKNVYLLIWTTTPWTLPGNFAIAISKDIDYSLVYLEKKKKHYIVAKALIKKIFSNEKFKIINEKIDNSDLLRSNYYSLLTNTYNKIIFGHHVSLNSGTGLVHISPYHGVDDFILGKEYKIKSNPVVNKKGLMINTTKYNKLFYLKANPLIVDDLKSLGVLYKKEDYVHDYPHDWRTGKPVYYLASKQFFINLNLKDNFFSSIEHNVNFSPNWGKNRLYKMLSNRKEWCISRQRKWGIPIIVGYDKDDNLIKFDDKNFEIISSEIWNNSLNIWFDDSILSKITNQNVVRIEKNIIDVWFDSGSAIGIKNKYFKRNPKFDNIIFLEGSDQYRGWFNSSFIINYLINNNIPCNTLYSHGFVLDDKNIKMSKSLGNVIDPMQIIKQYGADILRLWACSSNYHSDIVISSNLLDSTANVYRKIRNILKFLMSNKVNDIKREDLDLFLASKIIDLTRYKISSFNKYILYRLNKIIESSINNYKNFSINKIIIDIEVFFVKIMSNWYLEKMKNIIYIKDNSDYVCKSTRLVFLIIIIVVSKIMAPILPHTMEEIIDVLQNDYNVKSKKSIFLLKFIKEIKFSYNKNDIDDIEKVKFIFDEEINPFLALAKSKNNSNIILKNQIECYIYIKCKTKVFNLLNTYLKELYSFAKFTIVTNKIDFKLNSSSKIVDSKDYGNLVKFDSLKEVLICKLEGQKCERCWVIFEYEKINKYHNYFVCNYCKDILSTYIFNN